MASNAPLWVEYVHGIESFATTVGLVMAGWWAWRGDWRKSKAEREEERKLRRREEDSRNDALAQRRTQLRWDQAKVAREIIHEFLNDPDAMTAMDLVDCDTGV